MNVNVSGTDCGEPALANDLTTPPEMIEHSDGKHGHGTLFMAIIVCSVCKHMVYSPIEYDECDCLVNDGLIFRHCHNCGEPTGWGQFESHRPDHDQPLLYQTMQ